MSTINVEVDEGVREDAILFGRLQHGGNWSIALLVVRNVEASEQGSRPAYNSRKVSARQFADIANVSHPTVMRWYRQWERAADAGIVPHANDLEPGQVIELPNEYDEDDKFSWRNYRARVEASALRTQTEAESRSAAKEIREKAEAKMQAEDEAGITQKHDLGLPPGVEENDFTEVQPDRPKLQVVGEPLKSVEQASKAYKLADVPKDEVDTLIFENLRNIKRNVNSSYRAVVAIIEKRPTTDRLHKAADLYADIEAAIYRLSKAWDILHAATTDPNWSDESWLTELEALNQHLVGEPVVEVEEPRELTEEQREAMARFIELEKSEVETNNTEVTDGST